MEKKSITITLPKNTLKEVDTFIDGVTVRNRSHLFHIAIVEYMEKKRAKGEQLPIKPPVRKGRKK